MWVKMQSQVEEPNYGVTEITPPNLVRLFKSGIYVAAVILSVFWQTDYQTNLEASSRKYQTSERYRTQ
jgi:hypothetical protein